MPTVKWAEIQKNRTRKSLNAKGGQRLIRLYPERYRKHEVPMNFRSVFNKPSIQLSVGIFVCLVFPSCFFSSCGALRCKKHWHLWCQSETVILWQAQFYNPLQAMGKIWPLLAELPQTHSALSLWVLKYLSPFYFAKPAANNHSLINEESPESMTHREMTNCSSRPVHVPHT